MSERGPWVVGACVFDGPSVQRDDGGRDLRNVRAVVTVDESGAAPDGWFWLAVVTDGWDRWPSLAVRRVHGAATYVIPLPEPLIEGEVTVFQWPLAEPLDAGLHWYEVLVNGRVATRTPLTVVRVPPDARPAP